jgi:3-deoxy-D-manno-octulosonic-acid transferase
MSLSFLVYDIIIRVYAVIIRIAVPFNPKARLWVEGRKNWYKGLQRALPREGADIWIHCASLGEFEQGRPILDALRALYPDAFILLTFYSPSGFEVRKHYPGANHICYLPLDTPGNARRFISLVRPKLAIFVKYEFWVRILMRLQVEKIPLLLVSAIFGPDQLFMRWYGKAFRKLLFAYDHLFVQDEASKVRLEQWGIDRVTVTGDTRFDRVAQIASHVREIPVVEAFLQGEPALVAGSTWPSDEQHLQACLSLFTKWIIAPHDVNNTRLQQLGHLYPSQAIRYSQLDAGIPSTGKSVLIIDNVGMLSALYRYGAVAYIGGGFDHGIHNILEAAVYGMPVVFGPRYEKFKEARELITLGGAFSIGDISSLTQQLTTLQAKGVRNAAGKITGEYVRANTGATARITNYIQEKRFFTK